MILRYSCAKTTPLNLRRGEKKTKISFLLEASVRKYWYLQFFFFSFGCSVESTTKLFILAYFCLGMTVGNLHLMFRWFTIQVRNYITRAINTPPPTFTFPFPLTVEDYAVLPNFVSIWRFKVMSDAIQLLITPSLLLLLWPLNPKPSSKPPPKHHTHPTLRNLHCDWQRRYCKVGRTLQKVRLRVKVYL